jgi:hypothetical protein
LSIRWLQYKNAQSQLLSEKLLPLNLTSLA